MLHFHLLVVTIRFTPKSLSKFQLCDWSSLSWKPHFLIGLSKKETLGGKMSSPGVVQSWQYSGTNTAPCRIVYAPICTLTMHTKVEQMVYIVILGRRELQLNRSPVLFCGVSTTESNARLNWWPVFKLVSGFGKIKCQWQRQPPLCWFIVSATSRLLKRKGFGTKLGKKSRHCLLWPPSPP